MTMTKERIGVIRRRVAARSCLTDEDRTDLLALLDEKEAQLKAVDSGEGKEKP